MNPFVSTIVNGIKGAISGGGEGKLLSAATNLIDQTTYSNEEKAEMKLNLAKLEIEDNQHKIDAANKELELLIEKEKNQLADVANARAMQIAALNQDDKMSKHFIYYLAAFIVLAAVGFGILLFFVDVPKQNQRMVEMFADVFLFAGALTVLNFFFSSTVSSRKNSEVLREQIKK